MQMMRSVVLFASLNAIGVLATPIAHSTSGTESQKRDPGSVVVASSPGNSPMCDGKIWSPTDLVGAIQQATDYKANGQYQGGRMLMKVVRI